MSRSARVTMMVAGSVAVAAQVAVAGPWRPGMKQPIPTASARHVGSGGGSGGGTDGPGWSDNFDSYVNGSQLIGQGGWEGWGCGGCYPNNNPTGFASNAFAASAPNSLRLALANPLATPPTDQSDFVHQYTATGGRWVYRIKSYMPSTAVATTAPYFILLRAYTPASQATDHWAVQVHFEKLSNQVIDDNWMGGGVGYPTNQWFNQPLILDQWVEIRCEIDLDVQDGNIKTYYNNVLLSDHKWCDTVAIGTAPPYTIQATDLYDDGIDVFYFDDASLTLVPPPSLCYANCDASTVLPCLNVLDFGCFLNKFAAGDTNANCDGSTIVPVLNVLDFGCFLNKFASGCSSC